MEQLLTLNPDDIDYFTLNSLETYARVVGMYDADTLTLLFYVNSKPYKFKSRLLGIDCAEKRSKNPLEVEWCYKAIDYAKQFCEIDNNIVFIKCHKWDKYGRVLVEIFNCDKTRNLNQELVKEGLAYEYTGSTKLKFSEWCKH